MMQQIDILLDHFIFAAANRRIYTSTDILEVGYIDFGKAVEQPFLFSPISKTTSILKCT